jgi:outer membrane receptor protein involved in Fe transport
MVAHQYRVATSLLETTTPGFTVWDARGYWRAADHVMLLAGVENFTDRDYREHLDFRSQSGILQVHQPGVTFYSGAEVTY